MGVEKSAYRQPVTPEGLKAIEKKSLTWLLLTIAKTLFLGLIHE